MKKLGIAMMAVMFVWFIEACKNSSKNNNSAGADSTPATKDTASITANDVNKTDTGFVFEAASSGMTEVELGKMAWDKSASKAVKYLGARIVADQSKVNDTLAAIAKKKGIILPNSPTAPNQSSIDKLSKITGKDFDKSYLSAVIDDRKDGIKSFEYASKNCKDSELKAFAQKTLPVLQRQMDTVKAIQTSLK